MMSNEVIRAIDMALEKLKLNKLCRAVEDSEAYYFTGCGDNGESLNAYACACVNKSTLECRYCDDPNDPCWETAKTRVEIPEERKHVFMKRRMPYGDNGEYFELDDDD